MFVSSSSSQLDRVDWEIRPDLRLFPFSGKAHHPALMDYCLNPVAWDLIFAASDQIRASFALPAG